MQQQKPRRLRRFLTTPLGKALLIAITILIVFATYVYVETLLAIPAFLIFGLAVPIWAGLKRPRYLALSGLVVVLLVAPLSTVVWTQEVRSPLALSCSSLNESCTGPNNGLLQNASVTPYTGTGGTNFTWTVTIFPQFAPTANTTPVNVSLYVSTCPGATSGTVSPAWCSPGYPFYQFTQTVPANLTTELTLTFHFAIGSNGVWDWQMGVYTLNKTTSKPYFQTLTGDPTYNGIEGPVVGTFATTFSELISTIYFDDLLFLGGPFYLVLLIYMLFKSRERRRQEAQRRAAGPVPPAPAGGGPAGPAPPSATPLGLPTGGAASADATERSCPNCNAVVYANETKCWKCGAALPSSSSGAPLPSSPPK